MATWVEGRVHHPHYLDESVVTLSFSNKTCCGEVEGVKNGHFLRYIVFERPKTLAKTITKEAFKRIEIIVFFVVIYNLPHKQ